MLRIRCALLAASLWASCGGAADAETSCQTERPPNERTFHCIEMGSKRFRIPDGHLAFWQFPDPKTGRIERFDTMANEVRGKFTYFFFVSDLPNLTQLDFKTIAKKDDLSRRLTSVVMTEHQSPIPIMVELNGGRYVFSERLVNHLISKGYERATPSSPLKKGEVHYSLIRSDVGIVEIVSGRGGYGLECLQPYTSNLIVLTVVVGGDAPESACFHGRRVLEKLRSFEY